MSLPTIGHGPTMKWLSILSLICFSLTLSARLYAHYTYKSLNEMISKNHVESVFDQEPEKAIELLDALSDIPISNEGLIRIPASKQELAKKEDFETQLEDNKLALITAYMASKNNLDNIRFIQNSIEQIRRNMEMSSFPTENWDPRLVFFLMIREGLQLEDIDQLENLADIGISPLDMKHVKYTMETDDFLREILIYKGVLDEDIEVAIDKSNTSKRLDDALEKMNENREMTIEDAKELAPLDNMALEAKLVEMDYSDEEIEEITHGHNDSEEKFETN